MDSHHQPPESESGALLFELRGYTKWFRGLESNQLPPAYEADERPVLFPGIKNDPPAGAAPAWSALRVRCIAGLCHGGIYEWCSREDSHLEPPPSQSGVQDSYTSGALKSVRHAGAAPAPAVWKTAVLAVTPMTPWKMVAASGIAPDSPRLQRGANLSQLHSQWSLRAVLRRGLSVIGRLLCF